MKYLFIFGRDPVISKLELETYLKTKKIPYELERTDLYSGTKNKLNYYITAYNERTRSFLEDYLKAYFKKQRLKAVYKKPKHETIEAEPSQLIKKNIIEEGLEIITFK